MNHLSDMRRDQQNAKARANHDASDLRHMNPGRLKREAVERMIASGESSQLSRAIAIAEELDRQGIAWTRSGNWIHYLLADGRAYPLPGEGAAWHDYSEIIAQQISVLKKGLPSQEKIEALALLVLSTSGSQDLKWIRERMKGVSAPRFKKGFLVDAGLLNDRGEYLEITETARETQLLNENDGQFGPWFTATALGTAWIYLCYLHGNVPMTKAARHAPEKQFELDAIASAQEKGLATLPEKLRHLCGIH